MKNTLTLVGLVVASLYAPLGPAQVHHVYYPNKHNSNHVETIVKVASKGESGRHLTTDKKPLSDHQHFILESAYRVAKKDGLKKPEILSGIIMQESKAGETPKFRTAKHKAKHDQSVGLGQIKVSTAQTVLKKYPELKQQFGVSDRNLYSALANNDRFNVAVASKYVKILSEMYRYDEQIIAAYNLGPARAANLKRPWTLQYVKLVRGHINRHKLSSIMS